MAAGWVHKRHGEMGAHHDLCLMNVCFRVNTVPYMHWLTWPYSLADSWLVRRSSRTICRRGTWAGAGRGKEG